MPCINKNNLIYVLTYNANNPQVLNISNSTGVVAKWKIPQEFFYIQFSNDKSFKVFDINALVPEKEFKEIKDPDSNIHLMLDNGLEHFYSCADTIYEDIVIKHSIPAHKIIFLSAIPTMHDYIKKLSAKYNLPEIKLDWFSLFESTGKDTILKSKNVLTLQKKQKYERAYLNLNRRWRSHRTLMFTLLKDRNLLDRGYVSFAPSDDGWNWNAAYNRLMDLYRDHDRIKPILERNKDVVHTPPLYLDTEDLVTNRAEHETSINDYYARTYFSVINETTYHEEVPFFSEKIFKAIGIGHPFVIATAPNSLKYLRELGYKTFHPFINESYDTIDDHGDRMISIVNEIERLCKMDKNEFKSWRSNIEPIVKHNKMILDNKKIITKPMNY